ncbi:MAG: YHS domain-containing protein [Candidatus Zixiibacteriota bacterium]
MISTSTLTGAIVVAVSLMSSAFPEQSKTPSASAAPKELKPQTVCPVMGKPIDSSAYTDIQGQRVYHCCKGCTEKLTADPDKFFKRAAAEGVLFQNIQTTCPVSGEALEDKDIYTDYEGRRIYFCCKKCTSMFAETPQKFLKAMDAPANVEPPAHKEDHSGHHHGGH